MVRLTVRKFDPAMLKRHRIVLLLGRRGSGKSTLCEELLHHLSDKCDFAIFMTPTEESAEVFRRHAPSAWVHDTFSQARIDEMVAMQRAASRRGKMRDLLLVLDDMMFEKKCMKSTGMRDIHMNGRHLHLSFINCAQYLVDIPVELRSQVDYVFVLREPIYSNRVRLHRMFFGIFSSFQDFETVLSRCTNNYSALVLDNTQTSNNISDCVFWYRAKPKQPEFKIGKPVFWKLAQKMSKTPEQRVRDELERCQVARLERSAKTHKERVTMVQRQDGRGRLLKEDTQDDVLILGD